MLNLVLLSPVVSLSNATGMQFLSREQLEVIATNQLDELEQQLLQEHPHWQTSRWGCVLKDSPYYSEFCKVRDASPGGVMLRTAKDLQPDEVSIITSTGSQHLLELGKCIPDSIYKRTIMLQP